MKKSIEELEAEVLLLRKALEFYAAIENWYPGDAFKQSCRIDENDLEYFPGTKTSDLVGGKSARAALLNVTIQDSRRRRPR